MSLLAIFVLAVLCGVAGVFIGICLDKAYPPTAVTEPTALPVCPEWTAIERDWWASVLNSERGRKFIARARAVEYRLALENVKDQFHTQHSAGVVCGFSQCLAYILSLAACEVAAPKNSGEQDGAPSAERAHDDLLARISP